MPIYLRYEPLENTGQRAFWEACGWRKGDQGWYRLPETPRATFLALIGGAGIGKTKIGANATVLNAIEFPANYLIVAPTFQNHMLMTTLPEYRGVLEGLNRDSLAQTGRPFIKLTADGSTYHKTDRMIELVGGSIFFFRSAEEPENLYGPKLGGFHADEAGLIKEEAITILQDRLGRDGGKVGAQQGIFTFTPKGSKKHWSNRYFGAQYERAKAAMERGEPGAGEGRGDWARYPVFTLRVKDNPHIVAWQVEDRERRALESPLAYREYYGEWADMGGLIFEQFDYATHVRPVPERTTWVRYAAGVDFGMSAPTVIIVLAEDQNGRIWWCREFDRTQCSNRDLVGACRGVMDDFPGIQFYCDPHNPEIIKGLRANMIPARKAKADVNARVTLMWDRLAKMPGDNLPGLYVTPDCVNSIAEFEAWSWKATASVGGVITYDDVEPHAHRMDAGGYAHLALGRQYVPIPIETRRERAFAAAY